MKEENKRERVTKKGKSEARRKELPIFVRVTNSVDQAVGVAHLLAVFLCDALSVHLHQLLGSLELRGRVWIIRATTYGLCLL